MPLLWLGRGSPDDALAVMPISSGKANPVHDTQNITRPSFSSCLQTLGAQRLGDEALQPPSEDGYERNRNERDEVLLRALEDGVQPSVTAQPCERAFNHRRGADPDPRTGVAAAARQRCCRFCQRSCQQE
jgi:hypothetical protein